MRVWLLLLLGCGGQQVGFVAQEAPNTAPAAGTGVAMPAAPVTDLEADEQVVEPEHPAVKTPQERALTHIHTPKQVCSGVVIGPKLVATAHQCLPDEAKNVFKVPDKDKDAYKVEIASSTLTWTQRKVVSVITPDCVWQHVDLAVLVLDEAAPPLAQPVSITSAPGAGGVVQALGFGKCRGDDKPFSGRTGNVNAARNRSILIDTTLCQGDVGGPVFDTSANGYVGVISKRGELPGEQQRTSIVRFDTATARGLHELAKKIANGESSSDKIHCD